MRGEFRIGVVIPAIDEEHSIGKVLAGIPEWVDEVVVADNGSRDRTQEVARSHGAKIVVEPRRGYGSACLAGIAALDDPDVVVCLDGDFSDYPGEMSLLVDPILRDEADLVAGSRVLGKREAGALAPQARLGNWLACSLIRLFWGARYTDLGPFRAIRASTLEGLRMRDPTYGWMVEMQIKATVRRARVLEVPVRYRKRIGRSKVSGTLRGVVGAGAKILFTIFRAMIGTLPQSGPPACEERIILFTRYPEPGRTKTRLIPALGSEGAADLHRQMTEHVLARLRQFAEVRPASIEIRFAGGDRERMRRWLGAGLALRSQGQGDLGARMAAAFRDAFQAGAQRVVIVGTDSPGLTVRLLEEAFKALKRNDVVLGPSLDGGYYLIGLRRPAPDLFADMPWGTDQVLPKTLERAAMLNLAPVLLEPLGDVDRPEDLHLWEKRESTA